MGQALAGSAIRTSGTSLALRLAAGAATCLAGAGLLLWLRYGEAVFSQYLLGALAWCF